MHCDTSCIVFLPHTETKASTMDFQDLLSLHVFGLTSNNAHPKGGMPSIRTTITGSSPCGALTTIPTFHDKWLSLARSNLLSWSLNYLSLVVPEVLIYLIVLTGKFERIQYTTYLIYLIYNGWSRARSLDWRSAECFGCQGIEGEKHLQHRNSDAGQSYHSCGAYHQRFKSQVPVPKYSLVYGSEAGTDADAFQTFNKYQINVDDSANEDVLVHFLPSISFIQNELDKGRGVLVHCGAGISTFKPYRLTSFLPLADQFLTSDHTGRSATIIAAYLMYSLKLDPESAIDMIKTVRPIVE